MLYFVTFCCPSFKRVNWSAKMANRTVKDATSIKGTNPQYLVEKIIRSRIYESRFWKEQCFALTGLFSILNDNKWLLTSAYWNNFNT